MTGPQIMERMARNNAWANARLHGAVSALPPGAFIAPRSGFFPSIRQTMTHILDVDRYYLAALGLVDAPAPAPRTLGAMTEAQAALDGALIGFCVDLAPADLVDTVATDRGDDVVEEVLGALLMHLFQHQIHHRGQVHAMLSEAGAHPPQLDEFFLEFERHPTAAAFDAR
jgi:uncharacterized damage-inducible protein DinB